MKKRNIKLLLLLPLLALFHNALADGEHWTWNPNQYSNNSIFIAVITIDGTEQRSDQLEIGAFVDETCRGSIICKYEPKKDRYYAYLVVNGVSGMEMHFRLWDHTTDSELDVTCGITYTFEADESFGLPNSPYVFPFTTNPTEVIFNGTVNELWSVAGNWEGNALPTEDDIAVINAPCQLDQDAEVLQLVVNDAKSLTITDGQTLTAGSITCDAATKLVVADGGQLVCENREGVFATVKKYVSGYGTGNDKWCFIASPLVEGTAHTSVGNLVNEEGYDLYAFDQTEELEWRNFKINDLTLNPGEGYLYANTSNVTLEFAGELNSTVDKVNLGYGSGYTQSGWNLIGNPFTRNAYADRSYYVLDETGSAVNPVAASEAEVIAPCTGIMVKASGEGETVSFSPNAPRNNKGILKMVVSSSTRGASSDCAIVSFNPNEALPKYVFHSGGPQLTISQEGNEFAIVSADREGELPVNFKAGENGSYTISVNASHVSMDYLHLIDNLTGDDVNLLETPNYSFNARATDYASRFKIVFICGEASSADSGIFAYFNGTEWVVNYEGEAKLQMLDAKGRIVYSKEASHHVSTVGMAPGVYLFRLVNGNDVKTQKVVVR